MVRPRLTVVLTALALAPFAACSDDDANETGASTASASTTTSSTASGSGGATATGTVGVGGTSASTGGSGTGGSGGLGGGGHGGDGGSGGGGGASVCGDGQVATDEACDDGNTVTEIVCPTDAACTVCNASCSAETNISAVAGAVIYTSDFTDAFNGGDLIGYQLTVGADPIVVTRLGFYDVGGDGLLEPHDVALYDVATTQPVVTAQVPSGTAATLDGDGFRYVDVTPTLLTAGASYALLAYRAPTTTPQDAAGFSFITAPTTAPFITWDHDLAENTPGQLKYTTMTFGQNAWFGPSLQAVVHTP